MPLRILRRVGTDVSTELDVSMKNMKYQAREVDEYETPSEPQRPLALPRRRRGLWATDAPVAALPPPLLVVGLGRQLRHDAALGPRRRLGAGAIEALERRYRISHAFDCETRGYLSTCRASLDMTGRAGVQKIHFFQPVVDHPHNVGVAVDYMLDEPGMEEASMLVLIDDETLPFGQLRMRNVYDDGNERLRFIYDALGHESRFACLHIGCGQGGGSEALSDNELLGLPRTLANAATAIEVWLSEADFGLVARFVNRPELYATDPPREWLQLPNGGGVEPATESVAEGDGDSEGELLQTTQLGTLLQPESEDAFALFDLSREDPTVPPQVQLAPMAPTVALAALQERPTDQSAIRVAGRRFGSLQRLEQDIGRLLVKTQPGAFLRLSDDESMARTLMTFHPDGDLILDDIVAAKVDCSPVRDDVRTLWAIKFDGHQEPVSLRKCLEGLQDWLRLDGKGEMIKQKRRFEDTVAGRASAYEQTQREAVAENDATTSMGQRYSWVGKD